MRGTAILVLLLTLAHTTADQPTVDAFFPAGASRGATVPVNVIGKTHTDTLQWWVSHPGLTIVKTSEEKAPWRFCVEHDVPLGAHWVRAYNEEGSALPQLFLVGEGSESHEVEPNDSHINAQAIESWPTTIHGRLAKRGDVDAFAVALDEGQSVRISVDAYRIDAPIDPLLHITDAEGHQLAWNHDRYDSLDPECTFQAPAAGRYVILLSGFAYPPQARSSFQGSAETVYRLRLLEPLAEEIECPPEPQALSFETTIQGVVSQPGEVDRYAFEAVKDERYVFTVNAQAINSPLDAWLEIQDHKGKSLAKNDDASGADASLTWKAPSQGPYTLTLRDLLRDGGPTFRYELVGSKAHPTVTVTTPDHAWTVKRGEKVEIAINLQRRHGHQEPVMVKMVGLTNTCQAEPVTIAGEEKNGTLSITASEACPLGSKIVQIEADGKPIRCAFKGATTEAGALHRQDLKHFVLTVTE